MIRRLLAQLIADDPNPQPSQLDRWDGRTAPVALCAVLECTETPTTETHGWKLCQSHSPAPVRV